jgi:hypothetical protein
MAKFTYDTDDADLLAAFTASREVMKLGLSLV